MALKSSYSRVCFNFMSNHLAIHIILWHLTGPWNSYISFLNSSHRAMNTALATWFPIDSVFIQINKRVFNLRKINYWVPVFRQVFMLEILRKLILLTLPCRVRRGEKCRRYMKVNKRWKDGGKGLAL